MNWQIKDPEFNAVWSLPPAKRYEYCIKRMADRRQVWSLRTSEGWFLMGDSSGNECVPIWPHQRYADAFAAAYEAEKLEPSPIDFDVFFTRWITGMQQDQRLVAVFPAIGTHAIVVTPDRFRDQLQEELDLIE